MNQRIQEACAREAHGTRQITEKIAGSNPATPTIYHAEVAQLVEQSPHMGKVSPVRARPSVPFYLWTKHGYYDNLPSRQ